jgi:hypothetical protein
MPEIEDLIDIQALRKRMAFIEKCEPLKKSWNRDTLIMNLEQVISDVNEIKHIRTLPSHVGYNPKEA